MQDGSVSAILWAEAMLVSVQDKVFLPNLLNPPGYHTGPHFSNNFQERDRSDFGKVMVSLFVGEKSDQTILPPAGNVVMLLHQSRDVIYGARYRWAPCFLLIGVKSRWTRTFATCKKCVSATL